MPTPFVTITAHASDNSIIAEIRVNPARIPDDFDPWIRRLIHPRILRRVTHFNLDGAFFAAGPPPGLR